MKRFQVLELAYNRKNLYIVYVKLFSRFNIDDGFLKNDLTPWESSESFINGK